ncbi:MAG: GDSL-type esterase/lipase family protein [Alistipes sp.]|nr:GDSL-type esterase/lipase family protein [Alistipes sp.]
MKKLIFAVLVAALLPVYLPAQEPAVEPPAPNSYHVRRADLFAKLPVCGDDIVMAGNSITDGGEWAEFFPGVSIKNRGISADRTYHVLDRLDPIIAGKPRMIFLMIGTNDLGAGFSPGFTAGNIGKIIDRILTESPGTRLYVQTIFPVNDAFGQAHRHVNRDAEIVETNELIKAICAEKGVEVIDMWTALADGNGKLNAAYTNDGLHLTGDGYLRWVEVLKPYIQ